MTSLCMKNIMYSETHHINYFLFIVQWLVTQIHVLSLLSIVSTRVVCELNFLFIQSKVILCNRTYRNSNASVPIPTNINNKQNWYEMCKLLGASLSTFLIAMVISTRLPSFELFFLFFASKIRETSLRLQMQSINYFHEKQKENSFVEMNNSKNNNNNRKKYEQ